MDASQVRLPDSLLQVDVSADDIRRLSQDFSTNCPYNFVHLPWSTLAIVNFLDEEACAACWLRTKKLMVTGKMKGVRRATHHGLESNLVDYLSRAKGSDRIAKTRPLVFDRGIWISLAQACHMLGPDLCTPPNFRQIHLDLHSMSQTEAWHYLEQMTGTQILIDL
ncbi:unnamed protein product [Effrenium voratum]|uniref:Uncharacterized protein n=1 Tax=Effrenium voratum TaxID=2562239 RepID=A0AA36JGE5_9DINO|nr:unnamed protein product [Effrenium voratum]